MTRRGLGRKLVVAGAVVGAAMFACSSSSTTTDGKAVPDTVLTVDNYESWCSVAIASDNASSGSQQSIGDLAVGADVTLTATALQGFELGSNMWHDVNGDTGNGVSGTVHGTGSNAVSTAMITVGSAAACVWVCCPFTSGS